MPDIGRLLMLLGSGIFILGLILVLAGRVPWLGNLPGDIRYEGENFKLYFPLATMILLSILATVILNIVVRIFNR